MTKVKKSFLLKVIIVFIAVCCSAILLFNSIICNIKDNLDHTIRDVKEIQFNSIWTYIQDIQQQADNQVTEISSEIEREILNLPDSDFYSIQDDMNNNIHSDVLHEIIMKNIQDKSLNGIDNHRNGLVILTTDGYLEDFNYRRAVQTSSGNHFRSWDESYDASYNSTLDKNAIDKIINRTSGIIALESYDLTGDDEHIKIDEFTYDSLFEVYLNEGLNGLRNYQIFVPYYITNTGDIFDNPDIVQGVKMDNNKIIVIQEFNIYDQIIEHGTEVYSDEQVENLTHRTDSLLSIIYILGVCLTIAASGLLFYCCSIYNNLAVLEETNNSKDSDLDNEELDKNAK